MPLIPEHLHLHVDERRLVREVGQLFGSVSDALAEVVQNTYRAGACTLRVDVQGDVLTLADDGPGLEDPAALFAIGRSGWAEGVAVDPAGMGACALFALASAVEVTSRPARGGAWRAAFGPEAFEGAPIRIEPLEERPGETGLAIRVVPKPHVRLPDLRSGAWRHRYPLEVSVRIGASEPYMVPPVPSLAGVRIETPVGPVVIGGTAPVDAQDHAVWEHRRVRFPRPARHALLAHLPDTLAGRIAADHLRGRRIEWTVDPTRTDVRPKLPDRAHLIDDDALERALATMAAALAAEIDEGAVLAALATHVAGRAIVRDAETEWIEAPAALGALGPRFRASLAYPALGFVEAYRGRPPESFEVDLQIRIDEYHDEWAPVVDKVWVRPRFRVDSDAAEALALSDGIAAVRAGDDLCVAGLPRLVVEADALLASTSTGQIFARGLRYVSGGRTIAPVARVYSRVMAQAGADEVLAPRWRQALQSMRAGSAQERPGDAAEPEWLGLHPLPEGVRPIDYVRTSPAFARQALRESAEDAWPVWFWDYADAPGNTVALADLVEDLALLLATELGPETARVVARERRARRLLLCYGRAATALRGVLADAEEPGDGADLNGTLVLEIERAARDLAARLDEVTLDSLLAA